MKVIVETMHTITDDDGKVFASLKPIGDKTAELCIKGADRMTTLVLTDDGRLMLQELLGKKLRTEEGISFRE